MAVDHHGHHGATTKDDIYYLMMITDYAAKFQEAIPMKTSKKVAQNLKKLFSFVGQPEEILTDCRPNFTGRLKKLLYKCLRIKAIKTSPYYLQTDSMVEHFNTTMKHKLKEVVRDFNMQMDEALPYLLFADREVPHKTMGFTPFQTLAARYEGHWMLAGMSGSKHLSRERVHIHPDDPRHADENERHRK